MARRTLACTTYTDAAGRLRELIVRPGAHGSLLVLDRDPATLCDPRLVAHIPADEPPENALLVGRMYVQEGGRPCRSLTSEDLVRAPDLACAPDLAPDACGLRYALRPQRGAPGELPELRWQRRAAAGTWSALTLRDVLAALESYEPARTLTQRAIDRHERGHERDARVTVSVCVLRRELERVQQSAFVLNRALREAVLQAVRGGVSLSEIALRCGMVKRDRRSRLAGDTSWLARRVGLMPEGGKRQPSRWVHSETLGLIARQGLGLSPREVEL